MSELIRSGGAFNPGTAERRVSAAAGRSPAPSRGAVTWLVRIPLIATIVLGLLWWFPELTAIPGLTLAWGQLWPLVPFPLIAGPAPLAGPVNLLSAAMLVSAVAAWRASRSRSPLVQWSTAPLAALTGVLSLAQAVLVFLVGGPPAGLLLLVVMVGVSIYAVRVSLGVNAEANPLPETGGLRPLVLYAGTVVGPVAVARALFNRPARDIAASSSLDAAMAALPTMATVNLWLAGTCVGLIAWGVWNLLPPYGGRKLVAPIAALVLGVGVGAAHAFAAAAGA